MAKQSASKRKEFARVVAHAVSCARVGDDNADWELVEVAAAAIRATVDRRERAMAVLRALRNAVRSAGYDLVPRQSMLSRATLVASGRIAAADRLETDILSACKELAVIDVRFAALSIDVLRDAIIAARGEGVGGLVAEVAKRSGVPLSGRSRIVEVRPGRRVASASRSRTSAKGRRQSAD